MNSTQLYDEGIGILLENYEDQVMRLPQIGKHIIGYINNEENTILVKQPFSACLRATNRMFERSRRQRGEKYASAEIHFGHRRGRLLGPQDWLCARDDDSIAKGRNCREMSSNSLPVCTFA